MQVYITLIIGLVIIYLNRKINLCIIYFNAHKNVTVKKFNAKQLENANNGGKKFSPLTNLIETLQYTVWENWVFAGVYIAYIFNTYIVSKGKANLLEILVIYMFVIFSVVYDFKDHLGFNKINFKVMPALLTAVLLYICARMNNVNLLNLLVN